MSCLRINQQLVVTYREWTTQEATRDVNGYRYQCKIGNQTRRVLRVEVALNGLVVVLQPNGVGAQCVQALGGGLTAVQLRWMVFSAYSVPLWSDLSPDCAHQVIHLAGTDQWSDWYRFFAVAVGEVFYLPYPPDGFVAYTDNEKLWTFVESSGAALGFMWYADVYYSNRSSLYMTPIENDNGDFVVPTMATMSNATYNPLSQRLYLDVLDDPTSLTNTAPFIKFGLSPEGTSVLSDAGYIATSAASREVMMERLGGTSNYTGNATSRAATDKADYDLVIGVSLAVGGGLVAAALVALVVFFGLRRSGSGSTEESAPSTSAVASLPANRSGQEKPHTPP
jgi:hypothetical protein